MAAVLLEPSTRMLHIGPHKTGTTAVQGALHQARERLPAPAGVDHALGGQSFPSQVQSALDGGGAGLVRADMQQPGTRLEQDRSHNSPGFFAAPPLGF